LVLHILCGFSVDEVANAFVSTHAATEKRVARAKKVLADSKRLFDVAAPADVSRRLPAVQRALYLLFNEGYHGASPETAVRLELCQEAMRLTSILLKHPLGGTPSTHALAALMCLNAVRLPARVDSSGNLNSLFDQDRSQWDQDLAAEGLRLMDLSATGSDLTEYHLEAGIASIHARALSVEDTDWKSIVSLYDALMALRPSPVVALNRAIAIGECAGAQRGLEAIRAIRNPERLARYPFYFAALGRFELQSGEYESAREHFQAALAVARNPMERHFLEQRVIACNSTSAQRAS
jgi:RNA polymerase sigma-70 factor (ECF subfamily)